MNIIFNGSKTDSGYGIATESFKNSFNEISKFNIDFNIINDVRNYDKNKKYDIEFILGHPSYPDNKSGNYRIVYFYWEADLLPDKWSKGIFNSDEIWAPCELVREACLKSGYKNPIKIVPTPSLAHFNSGKIKLKNNVSKYFLNPNYYKFYSIFQWQPRKGYSELLEAYFDEFKHAEEVILILKINLISGLKISDIIQYIQAIKNKYSSKANVFLISDYLSSSEIYSLHEYSDCFVLPHYGEGWGMPIHEAAFFGNPIITTKYGGITDFLKENIYYINHEIVPVTGMEWNNIYSSDQKWAKPNIESLKEKLRFVFNSKVKKSNSFNDFSIKNVSNIIEKRINEITS